MVFTDRRYHKEGTEGETCSLCVTHVSLCLCGVSVGCDVPRKVSTDDSEPQIHEGSRESKVGPVINGHLCL